MANHNKGAFRDIRHRRALQTRGNLADAEKEGGIGG